MLFEQRQKTCQNQCITRYCVLLSDLICGENHSKIVPMQCTTGFVDRMSCMSKRFKWQSKVMYPDFRILNQKQAYLHSDLKTTPEINHKEGSTLVPPELLLTPLEGHCRLDNTISPAFFPASVQRTSAAMKRKIENPRTDAIRQEGFGKLKHFRWSGAV